MLNVRVNLFIADHEVPDLREKIGWDRRDQDYPLLFERCHFWAGARHDDGRLIAFGYVCGMGLQHGYMEDILVHPDFQGQGMGQMLVKRLLEEARQAGLEIVTLTFEKEKAGFYEKCGFKLSGGGVWQKEKSEG
ncbi:GNAT family N-acetyltransferase [Domibacillus sp. A3M-37]|uniref:GNAT family N-acetyltransferase n=1 Tax=Domibacillus sp. A3M-37 TaxID=2962037 RepID=UPI0020B6CB36|nr:GNAT family N-acetyltransferase [Domibacillus sp. A3M-37]MCP3760956.1 GNAT family N-acetyltransferase [Domibacillus sp. A3M-37]